ncbi:acid protease [Piedraia hortae CBS 480.64]|uniref:Acid protease n=1 Tax=Piedraia hortae CBS 480.64 TaxID=1314780 RepID=A0A6A7BUV8_9PEZI|nr:acid protease [Piedraia hortae CBS 480.64]
MPQQLTAWALAVLMATAAFAAPTPEHNKVQKRTVTVPVPARVHNMRSPRQEMRRTFAKYAFNLDSLPAPDSHSKHVWVAPNRASLDNRSGCSEGKGNSTAPHPTSTGASRPYGATGTASPQRGSPKTAGEPDSKSSGESDPYGSGGSDPFGSGSSDPFGSSGSDPLGSGGSDPSGSSGSSPDGSDGMSPSGSGGSNTSGESPQSGSGTPYGSGSSSSPSAAPAYSSSAPQPQGSNVPSSSPSAPSPSGSAAPGPPGTGPGSYGGGGARTGKVDAVPDSGDAEYVENVKLGSQEFAIGLDFDTGSSDLWVYSTQTTNGGQGHAIFDSSKSSTWKDYEGGSWKISYGDGSTASGTVGFDRVDVGGVVAEHQAIELAQQVSDSFAKNPKTSGLLGLGFSRNNMVKPEAQKTFFENVQNQLAQPVFTCDLRHEQTGSYTFGSIDTSQGEVHWVPIDDSKGWWMFESKSYSIGGQTQQCQSCHQAIADTGTSLMLVDQEMVDAYYKQVPGAQMDENEGGYVYDCSAKLPDFGVAIGDYMAIIPGKDITYGQSGDNKCFGGIQSNKGQDVQVWGDVFLKPFLAVFDGGKKRFGVIPKKSDGYDSKGNQPKGYQPQGNQPSGGQPSGDQPSGDQPSGDQPNGDQPSGDQSSGYQPSGGQSNGYQPSGGQSNSYQPGGDQSNGYSPFGFFKN